jgi:hypothetical protein
MTLLLAVAVMAVAVASWIITTTFRIRIRETMTDVAQARKLIQQCAERLRSAEKRLRTQSDHDQARWADEFETVRQQIGEAHVQLATHDAKIRQHEERLDEQGAEAGQAGPAKEEMAALQQAILDLDRRARQAEEVAAKSQGLGEQATAGLADFRHQADLRLAGVARDITRITRYLDGVRQFVRAQLDHDVIATRGQPGHRVLAGGICTDAAAAADILPLLYDSFLQQLPMDTLFHDFGRHYLLWRSLNGQPVESRLAELLRACPDPTHAPIPGLTELRSLLLALHHAGPATLQVGPLVVFRTTDQFAGLVLASGEANAIDGQSALPAPEECRSLLKALGDDRLTDLGGWADRQSAAARS